MKVLILGRTNVGKSSLFNRLIKKKKSLVINESKITRDLLLEQTTWWNHTFQVVDSGGFPENNLKEELSLKILEKIQQAMKDSDIFIMIVDGKLGLHSEDFHIMKKIRKSGKKHLLFVNKIDNPKNTDLLVSPFFELSSNIISGSCEQDYSIDLIVDWILEYKKKQDSAMPAQTQSQDALDKANLEQNKAIQLFVIGRANSGKSLLCNQILQKDRMIVSSISGTTLDTVTDSFSHNKQNYFISDNPGSRRGKREDREKISYSKSRSELEKSDIALLVIDACVGAGRQEAKLVQQCLDKNKPVLLVINKMDLIKKLSFEDKKQKKEDLKQIFHFCSDLPMVFISAKTGYHKASLFEHIESIYKKIQFRISTSALNNFFIKVIRKAPSPVYGPSDVKFYYINQTKRQPPEFIAFANYPKGVTPAYKRFVINQIKEKWDLQGIPISFYALPKR